MLRRISSQCQPRALASPATAGSVVCTRAQSYRRGPLAPGPALRRRHARLGRRAASCSALCVPVLVVIRWSLATASTYPIPRSTRSARSWGALPYTSSPATHEHGMPASKAASIIAWARPGLVANSTSSGTPALARRPWSSAQERGRYSSRSMNVCPPLPA